MNSEEKLQKNHTIDKIDIDILEIEQKIEEDKKKTAEIKLKIAEFINLVEELEQNEKEIEIEIETC
jgi:hypothetical protein